jgi:hypothetical protein
VGHPPDALIATRAQAVLREDARFHANHMLKAGVRQFQEWGNCDQGRHILIAEAEWRIIEPRLPAPAQLPVRSSSRLCALRP